MNKPETLTWQSGASDNTPPPPMVDRGDLIDRDQLFLKQYRKLGSVFRIPRPDKPPLTVLVGPEANVFVARYENEFFTTRGHWEDFNTNIGGNSFSEVRDGQANRQRRAQSSKIWSRARVLDQLARMIEITRDWSNWQPGESLAVRPAMQRIVAEQLGRLLVGFGPGEYLQDFITYLDMLITTSFGENRQWTPESRAIFEHAKERTQELGRAILQTHLDHPMPNGKPDMVDEAIAAAAEDPEGSSRNDLEGVGLGVFLAGLDTVANTCSFMIYALLDHPDVLKRVLDEVDAAFSQGPLTWEQLKNMTALHGAAIETLRRYPVANGHMATVAKRLTLAGYRLEPGDDIFVAMTVPHFLPELYPEPEKFDIDRFHAPRNEHRQHGAYAPFGLGDHTCLGAGIAEIQLMVTIATIFHDYQLELDPPTYQLRIENQPTPAPSKDFRVKAVARRGVSV
ncbi:MAG TPA: cytochrome P450 [Ktedonobacteraceae bacterium]